MPPALTFPAIRPPHPGAAAGCRHPARTAVVQNGVIVGWQCTDCPDVEPDNTPEPTSEVTPHGS